MKERRKISNPFTLAQRPNNKQNIFSFTKKPTPTKRSKSDCKRGSKKHQKSWKIEGCYVQTKAMMPTFILSPAIVTIIPIVPNPPVTHKPTVSTATTSCEMCKICGRPLSIYTKLAPPVSPPHSDWSDVKDNWDREK